MKKGQKLSLKQERFCHEYMKDGNATAAALRAGYSGRSAPQQGYELLGKTLVAARINELRSTQFKRIDMTADRILLELFRIATVDITQAFDEMGQLKPLSEIPEDVRRAISGLEVNEIFDGQGDQKTAIGLAKKIKFAEKTKAAELLGKHFKLFSERLEVSGKLSLEDLVAGSIAPEDDTELQ
jgi:phage terminase small subunit